MGVRVRTSRGAHRPAACPSAELLSAARASAPVEAVAVNPATGQQLFNRAVRLTIANADGSTALQTTGLRVQFKVKKSSRFEPNTAEIQVFNLNRDHRAALKDRGAAVVLEAGYTNTLAQIFSGNARTIDSIFQKPDWVSRIQCGDGEQAFQFSRISKGYGPGTSLATMVKDAAGQIGSMTADTVKTLAGMVGQSFAGGAVMQGKASTELTKLLAGRGYEWSIQDGKVQILPNGAATSETAVVVSPSTGLIGSPEHGTPEPTVERDRSHVLKFRSLLQASFKPGALCSIQSAFVTGLYRCWTVEHRGDTHSGEWISEVEATPTS